MDIFGGGASATLTSRWTSVYLTTGGFWGRPGGYEQNDTCNAMDRLTRPGIFHLIAFGFLATVVLLFLIYLISFSWWFYTETLILFVFMPVFIFLILSLWLDRKFKTQIKRYSILTSFLLLLSLWSFRPLKKWLLTDTEARGEILAKAIDSYKFQFGRFPQHLDEPYFDDVPKRALIYRPFNYHIYLVDSNRLTYEISCVSFNGQVAYRYEGADSWAYAD